MMQWTGVVIGLVKDLDDPIGEGRIRLQFPWFDPSALSGWAPIARTMAGKERGFYYMPELDDEALVAFEFGDMNHPYVIGFLHNGVDLPPDDDIDPKVRRVKTVSGHVLEFDDRSGKERITLHTQGGHHLEMKDASGTVEVKTNGGQKIVMKDQPAEIVLSTKTGTKVTIDDAPSSVRLSTSAGVSVTAHNGGVSIDAGSGMLNVNCGIAMVSAGTAALISAPTASFSGTALTIDAAITNFTGIVQCTALVASAVVSSSYTPGAGNLW